MRNRLEIRSIIISFTLVFMAGILQPVDVLAKSTGDIYGYKNLGLCNVSEGNLNIREEASSEAKLTGKFPAHAGCEILSNIGEWSYIKSGDVEGYILTEYLITGDEAWDKAVEYARYIVTAKTGGLRVRAEGNTDSTIIYQLLEGESLNIVENTEGDEWIKVKVCGGVYGYVNSEYVDVDYTLETAIPYERANSRDSIKETNKKIISRTKK